MTVTTSIELRKDQKEWLDDNDLNQSAWVREKIDEVMD
jgi:hypothetical protein